MTLEEENDLFYKRITKMYSDSIVRILSNNPIQKKAYMEKLNKAIDGLEVV